MATPPVMQPPPPAASVGRSRKSTRLNDTADTRISSSPPKREVKTSSFSSTTTTRTKILRPTTVQDEFDTGSDSESDLVTNSYRSSPTKSGDESGGNREYFTRESPSKNLSRSLDISSQSLSESRYNSPSLASDYANDRLNQIRNRLSLNVPSSYEKTTSSYSSPLDKEETPFLSHFTRRLSVLSSSQKTDDYKNDIIKEHDTNGSTSLYARSPMGSYRSTTSRPAASPYGFKINQSQTNSHWSQGNALIKNNVVSFAVLAGAALFFIFLAIAYLGMRSDTSVVPSDAVVPYCIPNDHSSKKGVNCLLKEEAADAFNLLSIIRRELHRRAVDAECNGHIYQRTHMTEDDIVKFCLTNFHAKEDQVKRDLSNIEILIFNNPEWHLSVLILDEDRDTVTGDDIARDMEQVIFNRDVKTIVALIQSKPDLPWSCTLYNGVKVAITASLVVIALTIALYGSKWIYKRYKRYEHRQRMELTNMVERILELLQQARVSDGGTEDGEHSFVVINHVRDMILPVTDRKSKEKLWQKAIQFINENESRVRTEVQEVKGEPFEVWRWIGSSSLSNSRSPPGSPSTVGPASWQGQAFETEAGAVNSLPCSPTTCLKVRGITEEGGGASKARLDEAREAVLSKCAHRCRILHCQADQNTSCVYLKCASTGDAAVAYRNLHGWWYAGRLVTVKYLRLERYMQRFPNSPASGPPFLISLTPASD
nr:unnamed protein product [Callosobruchus chinensis]